MIHTRRGSRTALATLFAVALLTASAVPAAADSVRDKQWHLSSLDMARVQKITKGAGVTVALIDTGVDAKHPDLKAAVLPGHDVYPNATGDGREDFDGHGTEMAGIIAGRGHGGAKGVLGIAPAAKILPVRAPVNVFATSDFLAEAITFAVDHGADVINMSFGSTDDEPLHNAIRKAQAADVVLVASVGNKKNLGSDYPGKYPEVLTVGAIDREGRVADFSVAGPQVDIVAPGAEMATTSVNDSGYCLCGGTSEAAAVVSGAAALVRAKYPEFSAAEVVRRLTATATDAGPKGRDDTFGYGRLDVLKALTADLPEAPSKETSTPPVEPDGQAGPEPTSDSSPGLPVAGAIVAVILLVGVVIALVVRRRRRSA